MKLMSTLGLFAHASFAADFDPQALLSKPLADVKPPVILPVGSYVAIAKKYEFDKAKNEKQTPIVRFTIQFSEPLPDVDEADFARAINSAEGGKPLNEIEDKLEFWITPDALYRMKEFGERDCKVPEEDAANTAELIELCIGRPFIAVRASVPNKKNPERPYINVVSTAPVPE